MFLVNTNKSIFKTFVFVFLILTIVSCKSTLLPQKNVATQSKIDSNVVEDKEILNYYASYKKSLDSQMNATLVYADVEMQKGQAESILSNFFSDAISNTCRSNKIEFDFAMPSTNGGIRASLPKGAITLKHAFELMPFENELVLLYLDGSSVKKLVQFIVDKGGQPVSGIQIVASKGVIQSVMINNMPLDETKTYRVLTSDYLANGGDGIVAFKEARKTESLNIKVRDAIIMYMREEHKAGRTLNPTLDGRIKIEQ